MRRNWRYRPSIRELTAEELGYLLHLSHTAGRADQSDWLKSLGGDGSCDELDYMLSLGRGNQDAVSIAKELDAARDSQLHPNSVRISRGVCDAVNFFLHSAISGEFGPDDSRDGRSYAFLKNTHVIPRAVSIFMETLVVAPDGTVLNHDEAEQRAAEYISENCS